MCVQIVPLSKSIHSGLRIQIFVVHNNIHSFHVNGWSKLNDIVALSNEDASVSQGVLQQFLMGVSSLDFSDNQKTPSLEV